MRKAFCGPEKDSAIVAEKAAAIDEFMYRCLSARMNFTHASWHEASVTALMFLNKGGCPRICAILLSIH